MTQLLPKVSAVFITYNRLVTLRRTLETFLINTDYPRELLELIVADDASARPVQEAIRAMPFDRFCLSNQRGGLGANQNRGLKAATGDYILQTQDDWECLGPPDYLKRSLGVMMGAPEIGMVILNEHPNEIAVRARRKVAGTEVTIYDNQPHIEINMVGQSGYTDWPHLKRATFHEDIGYYKEGAPMWICELDFARRVNRQTRYFVADRPGVSVFKHIGEEHSFNTGPFSQRLAKKIARLPLGPQLLHWYRARRKIWLRGRGDPAK